MARIHVLDCNRGIWNGAAHFTVPPGENAADIPWKDILLEHYPNPEPAFPCRTEEDEAEKAAIIAGDIVEIPLRIELDPASMEASVLQAALEEIAEDTIREWIKGPQERYRYWGYSQGDVV